MADINTSTGSTIHGVLVIVAACIGVIGYVIRSRFNQMEMEKQEKVKQKEERRRDKLKQEEERRRAALKHCKEQLELFIGPIYKIFIFRKKYIDYLYFFVFYQVLPCYI